MCGGTFLSHFVRITIWLALHGRIPFRYQQIYGFFHLRMHKLKLAIDLRSSLIHGIVSCYSAER